MVLKNDTPYYYILRVMVLHNVYNNWVCDIWGIDKGGRKMSLENIKFKESQPYKRIRELEKENAKNLLLIEKLHQEVDCLKSQVDVVGEMALSMVDLFWFCPKCNMDFETVDEAIKHQGWCKTKMAHLEKEKRDKS